MTAQLPDLIPQAQTLIRLAADEDLGEHGDITSALLPDPNRMVEGTLAARANGILAGLPIAALVAEHFSARLRAPLCWRVQTNPRTGSAWRDGDALQPGDTPAALCGPIAAVLTAERTSLNFLTRMSGVATLTDRYVGRARHGNPAIQVCDTRKTLPGWRILDKYAVRCGGGVNHRMGLHDAVLIKDNHLAGVPFDQLANHVSVLVQRARSGAAARGHGPDFVEVEVDSLAQLAEVARVPGIDWILLDNFTIENLVAAVRLRRGAAWPALPRFEASGGVTLETIEHIAATGVDRISVGAITHSAPALDLALDIDA